MIKISKKIFNFFRGVRPQQPKQEEKHGVCTRDPEEFERCAMCGAVTCIPISMPVDWRENYEMGFGQICSKCANEAKDKTKVTNTITYG